MGVVDMNSFRDDRSRRLSILRHFNVAGKEGAENWHCFVGMAVRTGFNNDDFRNRLGLSEFQARLWQHNAQIPSEANRLHSKRVIVGTLYDRYGFPMPNIPR